MAAHHGVMVRFSTLPSVTVGDNELFNRSILMSMCFYRCLPNGAKFYMSLPHHDCFYRIDIFVGVDRFIRELTEFLYDLEVELGCNLTSY